MSFFEKRDIEIILGFLVLMAVASFSLRAAGIIPEKIPDVPPITTQQLRVVDSQGRLRFTIDSVITSYDSSGRVKGIYR